MKVSLNWLSRYVALSESPSEIAETLTLLGFEVDGIETTGLPQLENVVVGEVKQREQHPNADRLGLCQVDLGESLGEKSIVCGASNYKVGDRVPVALPGAVLPGGFKIKRSKLRGVESDGMMCSGKEIGYGDDAGGLLILQNEPALGTPINQVLTESDTLFTLEVTPNRPDCLCHLGIARELAAWYRRELCYPEVADLPAPVEGRESILRSVLVDAPEDCPLYVARVIRGVAVAPSPPWLQEALRAIGLRPINNVVDVSNFVLHETGNPMHAFDARDIKGGTIRVRPAFNGECITTLDGVERKLSEQMLVIADEERSLAIAGVMGGENSEVKPDTVDLVLEVAYFNPTKIRWVSKKLGLSSDSSYRFERGVDPNSLQIASDRAVQLILDTAGGEIAGGPVVVGKEPATQSEVEISPDWIRAKAGFEIANDEIRDVLESLELLVSEPDATRWVIGIPSHRGDLDRPIDILEEVLRIYGTHRIPGSPVVGTALAKNDNPITQFERRANAYLVGQNFAESVSYTLRSRAEQERWSSLVAAMELAISNPISEDQTQLRHSLLPGLLETLRLNQARGTGATRFFEIGRTFREFEGKISEMLSVAFVECSVGSDRSWHPRAPDDFFLAKQRIQKIAAFAGFDLERFKASPVATNTGAWQAGHSAAIDDLRAGIAVRMGLMDLERTKGADVKGEVTAGIFSLFPERLGATKRASFQAFSAYPSSAKDLALVVNRSEPAAEVLRTIKRTADKATQGAFVCENVNLFDIYEGSGIEGDRKSLAVTMTFRSCERTLTDTEVNSVFSRIQEEVCTNTNYEIRE